VKKLQKDINTYTQPPADEEDFKEWKAGFNLEARTVEISQLLSANNKLRAIHNELRACLRLGLSTTHTVSASHAGWLFSTVCALRSPQAHLQRVLGAVLLPLGETAQGRRAQGEDPHAYVLRPWPPLHENSQPLRSLCRS
jgi:hypothetical protein